MSIKRFNPTLCRGRVWCVINITRAAQRGLTWALGSSLAPIYVTPTFAELETTQDQLWDYGWFTVTRFSVPPQMDMRLSAESLLDRFIHDPVYPRSYCESPDPWGARIDRHGPFLISQIQAEWFHRTGPTALTKQLDAVLNSIFDTPPTCEQQRPIQQWLSRIAEQRLAVFTMQAPATSDVRVEWSSIWRVFQEFIAINEGLDELTIAVIGYD